MKEMENKKELIADKVEVLLDQINTDDRRGYYLIFTGEDGACWSGCKGDGRDIAQSIIETANCYSELKSIILAAAGGLLIGNKELFMGFATHVAEESCKRLREDRGKEANDEH